MPWSAKNWLRRQFNMPFKEKTLEQLAKELNTNLTEVREKQRLIERIVKLRKDAKLSQVALAKKAGVSQARIAQIESGIGTSRISFDVLFNIIHTLGFECQVRLKKLAVA